jgi:hypothetical protein
VWDIYKRRVIKLYGYWCLLDAYEKLIGLDFGIKKRKKKKKSVNGGSRSFLE